MNGVGLGFHEHNQVNYLNPASYASIDSMTFILDAGISGQVTNFEENGVRRMPITQILSMLLQASACCHM